MAAVVRGRRPPTYTCRWLSAYDSPMGDSETWGGYLKRMTSRPGWSVARLARESGIHRATIFGWIAEGSPPSVKLDSVKAIAKALGDDLGSVLRVVGEVTTDTPADPELDMIRQSKISKAQKKALIKHVLESREIRLAELEILLRGEDDD